MMRLSLPVFILAGMAGSVFSQTFTRRPFLQKGSPTNASVCWRVTPATVLTVRYGTDSTNLNLTSAASPNATDACVVLNGLQPTTRYYYQTYAGATRVAGSPSQFFVTHPPLASRGRYTFWLIGDAGTGTVQQTKVRDAYLQVNGGTHSDGFIMLGDNAYSTGTDAEFTSRVFTVYRDILATSFTWPTVGNHENMTAGAGPYLAAFYMPSAGESGGVPSGSELYYSYDYGNVHFICLDSEISSRAVTGAQYLWLRQDLQATRQDWIVVFFHHPPYTWGSHNSDVEQNHIDMRQNFLPLMEQYGVDLEFGGHSHDYERSYLLDSAYGNSANNLANASRQFLDNRSGNPTGTGPYRKASLTGGHQGTVYTVDGSSGQVTAQIAGAGPGKHPTSFIQSFTLGSVLLTVDDSVATARFIDSAGVTRDQFQVVQVRGPTALAETNGRRAPKFWQSGRTFRFPAHNTTSFRIYALGGELLRREMPQGNWEIKAETLPSGEYFYRFGSAFGRMSLP